MRIDVDAWDPSYGTAYEAGDGPQAESSAKVEVGVERHLRALEVAVSSAERDGDDLLVVDGPLQERAHLPRALGYVKTHHKTYLPGELSTVVTGLRPGQRSPVFLLGTNWHRYSWY